MFGNGGFGQTTGGYRGFGGPTPGADLTADTTLDFRTAIRGDTVSLQLPGRRETKVKIRQASPTGRRSDSRAKVSRARMAAPPVIW